MENQAHLDIFIGVAVLSLICAALAFVVFFNTYRRKMIEKEIKIKNMQIEYQFEVLKGAAEAEEKQKEEIGKNLHDGIIPILSAVERSLDKNIHDFESANFDISRLKSDLTYLQEISINLRGISHDLAPQSLISMGLFKALEEYIAQINSLNNSAADFENLSGLKKDLPFTVNEQVSIYRVCLELLNNLGKHSDYTYLKLSVEKQVNNLEFVFMHNGKGISSKEIEKISGSSTGIGLKSLKSRALLLGAKYEYLIDETCASIIFTIPIKI